MRMAAMAWLLAVLCASAARAGEIKPEDPGLNGGKGGHWGIKNDKDWIDGRWNNVDVGPLMSCALGVPGGNINKGIAIRLGEKSDASVCFDGEKCGVGAAWTGGFVHFSEKRFGLIEPPNATGAMIFSLPGKDLWNGAKHHYRGLFLNGARVTLAYQIADAEILESPWIERDGTTLAISRALRVGASQSSLNYTLAGASGMSGDLREIDGMKLAVLEKDENCIAAALVGTGATLACDSAGARIMLDIAAHSNAIELKVLLWSGKKAALADFAKLSKGSASAENLEALCKPAAGRWGAALPTKGSVSTDTKAYVIDSLPIPFANSFKAMFFCSGIDFLDNGDAVISTLHGDVWLVSGIDAGLQNLSWKRFATGLFQPFGVKIVKNQIYVLGRDQITRLHDLNGDGEADQYENFCNLMTTSAGGHSYSAGLETDSAGNFYHVDPLGLHRISKTGETHETIATGWRNPVSVAVGPEDSIVVAPQEGEWTPASEICEVKAGGYYGFGGPRVDSSRPLGYDLPLCFIPRNVDNSTGGMIWAPEKWGALSGQMLDLSFGQCSISLVLREKIGGQTQGGIVPLGLKFPAGVVRGRVNPKDGQLYVAGTQGWVTSAVRDGCLQRVRYTGAKMCVPVSVKTKRDGLEISFSEPLDRENAEDVENYAIEQWNYRYSATYGSREYSAANPDVAGHDAVTLASAKLSADGKTVFLKIDGLKPVNQMRIKTLLKDAIGGPARHEINYSIHRVE
jgi:hypothetical protein